MIVADRFWEALEPKMRLPWGAAQGVSLGEVLEEREAPSCDVVNAEESGSGSRGTTGPPKCILELQPVTAEQLIKNAPQVEYLVDGILPVESSLLVSGDSGIGKTWMTLDLAMALDQGRPWLDHFPTQRGRVLVIDEENAIPLLKERLQKLLRAGAMPDDGTTLGVQFLPSQGINLSDPAFEEAVERVLAAGRPDLVIMDSLGPIHGGIESDTGEMATLFRILKRWMNTYGCAFVLCHHHRTAGVRGADSAHRYRGSSAIRALVDAHLELQEIKGQQAAFSVEHSISRYGQLQSPFTVQLVEGAEDAIQVRYAAEAKSRPEAKLHEAQEFIKHLAADEQRHSRREIQKKGEDAGLKQHMLDTARKRLIEVGELNEATEGKTAGIILRRPD